MGGWLRISLPLIAEAKEIFEDHRGRVLTHRRPGDLCNEARMSREDFERFKRSRQPHIFEAQYQQHPSYGGSGFGSKSLTAHRSRRPLRGLLRMRARLLKQTLGQNGMTSSTTIFLTEMFLPPICICFPVHRAKKLRSRSDWFLR